jgi:geranylgeranyl diphosphate synthase type 3
VLDKVGGLFRLGTKLMQLFSSDQRDFVPLANLLALFFQLIDDYNNLSISDTNTLKNKSFCEDLTEGKFSFPIIHSINSCKSDHRLLHILKRRTEDITMKKYAVEYIRSTGSFTYTADTIESLRRQILDEIEKLGGNAKLSAICNAWRPTEK